MEKKRVFDKRYEKHTQYEYDILRPNHKELNEVLSLKRFENYLQDSFYNKGFNSKLFYREYFRDLDEWELHMSYKADKENLIGRRMRFALNEKKFSVRSNVFEREYQINQGDIVSGTVIDAGVAVFEKQQNEDFRTYSEYQPCLFLAASRVDNNEKGYTDGYKFLNERSLSSKDDMSHMEIPEIIAIPLGRGEFNSYIEDGGEFGSDETYLWKEFFENDIEAIDRELQFFPKEAISQYVKSGDCEYYYKPVETMKKIEHIYKILNGSKDDAQYIISVSNDYVNISGYGSESLKYSTYLDNVEELVNFSGVSLSIDDNDHWGVYYKFKKYDTEINEEFTMLVKPKDLFSISRYDGFDVK